MVIESDTYNGPQARTLEDIVMSLLTKLLETAIPADIAGIVKPMIGRILRGVTGNDVMLDTVLQTNMTPMGVYQSTQDRYVRRLQQSAESAYVDDYLRMRFTQVQRLLDANKSDIDIQKDVDGMMQNMMLTRSIQFANNILGFDDQLTTGRFLSSIAANVAGYGLRYNEYDSLAKGKHAAETVTKIITDKDFNAADWGFFGPSGIAELGSRITKDTQFYTAIDASDSGQMERIGNRLKDTIQSYARALAPLKDVFGNDIPKMVSTLEGITGQSLANMDTWRVENLSRVISYRSMSGIYGTGAVASVTQDINGMLSNMPNIGAYGYLSGAEQATAALDRMMGVTPNYRTSNQWKAAAEQMTVNTWNSNGADMFAKAYSLWAHKARLGDAAADISYSRFKTLLEQNGYESNPLGAAMRLAGVSTMQELNQGVLYDEYALAKTSGDAGNTAFDINMEYVAADAAMRAGLDVGFINGLAGDKSSGSARDAIRSTFAALKNNPELINMETAQRSKELSGLINPVTGNIYNGAEIGNINASINYLKAMNPRALDTIILQANADSAIWSEDEMAQRERALYTLENGLLFKDGGESGLVKKLLDTKGNTQEMLKALQESTLIQATGNENYKMIAAAGATVATSIATRDGIVTEEEEREAKKNAAAVLNYGMSFEGMTNKGFLKALSDYTDAYNNKKPEDMINAASRMYAYSKNQTPAVDAYIESGNATAEGLQDLDQTSKAQGGPAAVGPTVKDISNALASERDRSPSSARIAEAIRLWKAFIQRNTYDDETPITVEDWETAVNNSGRSINEILGASTIRDIIQAQSNVQKDASTAPGTPPVSADKMDLLTNVLQELLKVLERMSTDNNNVMNTSGGGTYGK